MITIRKYRKDNNMTQTELANILGVTPSAVTMWESGNREPNLTTLKRIATIFNCTVDELIKAE